MKVRHVQRHDEKVELQMTPMIDIVFQLLVFFIMTFKIATPEGDFNIRMPLVAPSEGLPPPDLPPIKVRMEADSAGRLSNVVLGTRQLDRADFFGDLRRQIRQLVGDAHGPGSLAAETEVELDCDYNLHYQHVMDAITAVSGYVDGQDIITVIEKIKFSPARGGP